MLNIHPDFIEQYRNGEIERRDQEYKKFLRCQKLHKEARFTTTALQSRFDLTYGQRKTGHPWTCIFK